MSNPHANGFAGSLPMGGPQPSMSASSVSSALSEMRSKIFSTSSANLRRKIFNLNGVDIELRQPTLAQAIDFTIKQSDYGSATVYVLVNFSYVPGTDEKVFTDADVDLLNQIPAGPWVKELSNAFNVIQGIELESAEKNSETTP